MMKHLLALTIVLHPLLVWQACQAAPTGSIREGETTLPLAYDVDVVVAGGSLAGVEAACAAADAGASVLLVESRPYLGTDLCANQKLWLDPDEKPETRITQWLFKDKRQVTPLEVKGLMDRALLKRKVQFLTGSFPAELLVDQNGAPAGLTMVNRSGRQAVRAKVVIDATADAVLVRQCPGVLTPFVPGKRTGTFTVIGGELKEGNESVSGRRIPGATFQSKTQKKVEGKKKWVAKPHAAYTYDATVELDADSFRARSAAMHRVRSFVSGPQMLDHSEDLLLLPERTIITDQFGHDGNDSLAPFQPKGMENLFVLSGYAGIKDRAARLKLLQRPVSFAPFGQRIGTEAARIAGERPSPETMDVQPAVGEKGTLAASEVPNSFRFRDRPQLELSEHDLPVLGRWDVVVVGAGTSGAPAALGAARSGARTLAIEYMDELGGVGTAGLVAKYWYGFQTGYTAEVDKALGIKDAWNPIEKSEWLRHQLLRSGAEVWFSSYGCGTLMKGDKVSGVIVATPFGRGVVLADVVIDSSGNCDIAAAARAHTHYSISKLGDLSVQISNNPPRKLGAGNTNPARYMVHDHDVFDRWHLKLSGRAEGSASYDMAQFIPSRDRRRSVGDYVLTTEDILTKRTFPDTISHHRSNFDAGTHPDSKMFLLKDMKGPVFTCDMPYRCATPRGLEGILVTGLGSSTTRDAMTLVRMQPDLQNQGYALGKAAALAVLTTGGRVREIDLKALQKELVKDGCLEERVLTDVDSFPLGPASIEQAVMKLRSLTIGVHQKPEHDDTHPALAVVMSHPQQSIPLLKDVYNTTSNPDVKLNFARILAILGDAAGKKTLLAAVEGSPDWGKGWDYSNQRKYANTFGDIDRIVIALGFIRTPEIHGPLLKKLNDLKVASPLSHYKAICLALRMNRDPSMAKPIADFLKKSGLKGHAQVLGYFEDRRPDGGGHKRNVLDTKGGKVLNTKFKEVLVAALLFECGDHQGEGRKILEAYTKDVNGHFAAYAHHVLTHGTALAGEKSSLRTGAADEPAPAGKPNQPGRVNIIVIMADDLGYSDLGCYGGEIQTPNIDQLAKEGVRFTGFKNTCRCTPSRASLLTGRYAHSVGVGAMSKDQNLPGYRGQLSADAPTMAEILRPQGYATGIVGKWHQTFTGKSKQKPLYPLDRGFDFFYGTWWGAKDYFSPRFMMRNHEHIDDNTPYPADYYLTHALSDSAVEFVQNQIDQDRPFCLYLAHYAPHAPIQAPADRIQKCVDRYMAGFETLQRERFARQLELGVIPENAKIAAGMPGWDSLSPSRKKAWAKMMATYAAMIEVMDDGIGTLIETLKKNGQYDNTLILVLSDNGSTPEKKGSTTFAKLSNTPYRSYKAHTFEGGIASPLIVSWPAKLREHAGKLRHGPCHIIDILPTCLEAAGVAFPAEFRGRKAVQPDGGSMLDAVTGTALPKRPLFWEHGGSRSVYQDGWKLVADGKKAPWQLFDLTNDPTEQSDLSKQYPERAAGLKERWSQWANENKVLPLR